MLLPLRDVIPSRIRPWVTLAVLALLSVAFATERGPSRFLASAGWVTFVANAFAIWIFGETVESRLGHARFLLFCAGAAVLGSLAPGWAGLLPLDPPPGASAIAGAISAAYFVLYPTSRVLVIGWLVTAIDAIEVPSFFFAGLWVLAQLFEALSPLAETRTALLTCAAGIAWGLVTVWVLRRPVDWGYTPGKSE